MRLTCATVLAAAAVLAGCGGSPGDLIAIEVHGGAAHRNDRIVVQDNGDATCNGGAAKDIGSAALLDARELEHDVKKDADRAAVYEGGRRGGASYVARTKDGTVRWQEGAPGLPSVLARAQLFALQQGRNLC